MRVVRILVEGEVSALGVIHSSEDIVLKVTGDGLEAVVDHQLRAATSTNGASGAAHCRSRTAALWGAHIGGELCLDDVEGRWSQSSLCKVPPHGEHVIVHIRRGAFLLLRLLGFIEIIRDDL